MEIEVSLDFISDLTPSEKVEYGGDRVADITGKPEFADSVAHGIVLADATTASGNLSQGIQDADGGNDLQKQALFPLIKAWDKEHRKLGKYVEVKAREKKTLDEQIAIVNIAGFGYNKVTRSPAEIPPQVLKFNMSPLTGFSAKSVIKSDPAGRDMTYVTIFNKKAENLDLLVINGNQVNFPASADAFIIHTTRNSGREEVTLTAGEKWYGLRYAVNSKGRGPNSEKSSVIPQ